MTDQRMVTEKQHWYLYLVRGNDGSLYTGITMDVQRRFAEHQQLDPGLVGEGKSTGKSAGKSAGKSTGKSAGKSAGKSTGKSAGKSVSKSAGKSAGKGAKALRGKRPLALAYQIPVGNRSQAAKLEYRVKQLSKSEKEDLVNGALSIDSLDDYRPL